MVAVLFQVPQFFDNNGAPLGSGRITTSEPQTTTPKAAYTDNTATTPLPNPIILDATGRITAGIWLLGGYRIEIADAFGVVQSTFDNVNLGPGTTISTPATAQVEVPCTNGQILLTAAGLVPPNARLLGVYSRNIASPGTSNGLTGYNIGSHQNNNRWGTNIGLTPDLQTTIGNFALSDQPVSATAEDILIIAQGGTFDGVGLLRITAEYATGAAP